MLIEALDRRLLHRVVVHGYVDLAPGRELATDELVLSRSPWFGRLRQAADRPAEHIVG